MAILHTSNSRNRVRRILKKLDLVLLAGGVCTKCGYNRNIASLVFHHVDDKHIALNGSGIHNNAVSKLEAEVAKCILLCHNCHTELHNPELYTSHVLKIAKDKKDNRLTYTKTFDKYFKA